MESSAHSMNDSDSDSGDLNLDLDPGVDLYDGATSEESETDDDGGFYFSLCFY